MMKLIGRRTELHPERESKRSFPCPPAAVLGLRSHLAFLLVAAAVVAPSDGRETASPVAMSSDGNYLSPSLQEGVHFQSSELQCSYLSIPVPPCPPVLSMRGSPYCRESDDFEIFFVSLELFFLSAVLLSSLVKSRVQKISNLNASRAMARLLPGQSRLGQLMSKDAAIIGFC